MKYGFTLLELSIVLVIIGLIVGGVVAGKELIHQAEINQVMRDGEGYNVAINTFRLKYNALPGDMVNATDYWPSCGTTADVNTNAAGCNGNGSGIINIGAGFNGESLRAWQHLSLAEVIPQQFSGELETGSIMVPGKTVPAGPMDGTGYELRSQIRGDGTPLTPIFGKRGNLIEFASFSNDYNLSGPSISGQDAYAVDHKYDDGTPSGGKIFARSNSGNCTTPQFWNPGPATYIMDENIVCDLIFWIK